MEILGVETSIQQLTAPLERRLRRVLSPITKQFLEELIGMGYKHTESSYSFREAAEAAFLEHHGKWLDRELPHPFRFQIALSTPQAVVHHRGQLADVSPVHFLVDVTVYTQKPLCFAQDSSLLAEGDSVEVESSVRRVEDFGRDERAALAYAAHHGEVIRRVIDRLDVALEGVFNGA